MSGEGQVLLLEDLEHIPVALWNRWLNEVPPFRRDAALRYRFHADRVRSLAAFRLLCVALGYMPGAFEYGAHGKPTLAGGPYISLSHSTDCAAAAVSPWPVGIDVETLRAAPLEVMPRVFTARESQQIESARDTDRTFFSLWTLKESYLKMTGDGLHFPLQDVEITLGDPVCCSRPGCRLTAYSTSATQLGVCGRGPITIEQIPLETLEQRWNALPGRKADDAHV